MYPKKTNKNQKKKKGPKNKAKKVDKQKIEKVRLEKEKKTFKPEPISKDEISNLIYSIEQNDFNFSEDEIENFEEVSNKDKRNKLYNKDITEGKIIQLGKKEIQQTKNLLRIQSLIKINTCNYDFENQEDLEEDNFGLDAEEKENPINSSSSDEEYKPLSLINKSKINIENQEKNLKNSNSEIYQEINSLFIFYKKKIISYKPLIWIPDKVQYSNKKYYLMTKLNQITENGINHLNYYCNNHRLNTSNKKIYFKNNSCDGQIQYIRDKNKFFFTHKHNSLCNAISITNTENIAETNENIKNYNDLKDLLTNYLNKHPLINLRSFKKIAIEFFLKGNYDFTITKHSFKNLYYTWKRNSKIFSWFSIFDNCYIKDNTIFLKDVANSYIYNAKGDGMFWHRHILWASNFHIKRMRLSHHFYLDGTFLSTKEFYQILILMYYDENSCKKVPGSYILINNKLFKGYTIALNAFKRILTGEDKIPINLYSITTDFEVSLIEAVQNVFPKSRIVGCMFHYIKQLRLLLSKYGLFISEYENTTNELFKALSKSPFVFHNNKNYIENTFNDYLKNSIDENHKI